MKRRVLIAVVLFIIITVIGAVRWHNHASEAAAPQMAAIMVCVEGNSAFEVTKYEPSPTVPLNLVSIDGPCATAVANLLGAGLQLRSVLAPQLGIQYYVFTNGSPGMP